MFPIAEKTIREFSVPPKRREAFDAEARKAEAASITVTRSGSETLEPVGIQKHGCPTRAEKSVDGVELRSTRHVWLLPIGAAKRPARCEVTPWHSSLADQNNKHRQP